MLVTFDDNKHATLTTKRELSITNVMHLFSNRKTWSQKLCGHGISTYARRVAKTAKRANEKCRHVIQGNLACKQTWGEVGSLSVRNTALISLGRARCALLSRFDVVHRCDTRVFAILMRC